MGKLYDEIDGRLREFILAQPVFFVATAPSDPYGHVNVSPKGMRGTFAVLGPRQVAYLDYTGSGIETAGHLRDNGRITIMFCAFAGPPNIVRLHGRGEYIRPGGAGFASLRAVFEGDDDHGVRGVVRIDVDRVSDSCGFAVPFLDHVGDRDLLTQWAANRSEEDLRAYRSNRNATTIDGLPALA